MKTAKMAAVSGLLIGSITTAVSGGEVILQPVYASGVHSIDGTEITLDAGGQIIVFDIFFNGWDPDLDGLPQLRAYQVTMDSASYQSDFRGTLAPALVGCSTASDCAAAVGGLCSLSNESCFVAEDCPFPEFGEVCEGTTCDFPPSVGGACKPAFISENRPDFVLAAVDSLSLVDISTINYRYAAFVLLQTASDTGTRQYAGTLMLDVPADAIGTFTVDFLATDTYLQDPSNNVIGPLTLVPALVTIPCESDLDCDDLDLCTTDSCQADGTCLNVGPPEGECCDPSTGDLTTIDDGNECTTDTCDVNTGVVDHTPLPVGTACGSSADSECDHSDTCDALGVCQSNVEPIDTPCGDPTVTECTDADTCDGAGACLTNDAPAGAACGDPTDTPCDYADTCSGTGVCQDNFQGNGAPCSNGPFCHAGETCTDGVCGGGSTRDCSDGLDCTIDSCNEDTDTCDHEVIPGFCAVDDACWADGQTNKANECQECVTANSNTAWSSKMAGLPCGDGSATQCTNPDACDGAGTCAPNHEPNGTKCDDGDYCTVGETCETGTCGGDGSRDCDDGVGCTEDFCDELNDRCDHTPMDLFCDNGNFCDGVEVCDPLADCVVLPGTVPDCDDLIDCTVDSCDELIDQCVSVPNDALCSDDGEFCTGDEVCVDGFGCDHTGSPCPGPCDEIDDRCTCYVPVVVATGSRYLRIIPQSGEPTSQGIIVTPDCGGPSKYVGTPQDEGPRFNGEVARLVDDPQMAAWLMPSEWGEVYVHGDDLVPATTYLVQTNCGSVDVPALSDGVSATTTIHGDTVGAFLDDAWTPPNGEVDIVDVVAATEGFSFEPTSPPMDWIDSIGTGPAGLVCHPDKQIDIQDILMTLDGFEGKTFGASTGCPSPCGP